MSGISTQGKDVQLKETVDWGSITFASTPGNQSVFSIDEETSSIIIQAKNDNDGLIYVGYDENNVTSDGQELAAGQSLSGPLDVSQQQVFVEADTVGDEIRFASFD